LGIDGEIDAYGEEHMIHKVAAQNGLAAETGAEKSTSKTTEKLVDDSYLLD